MITKEEWKKFRGSGVSPDHIMISIIDDAETCMAVTWRTCLDVTDGYVNYRKFGDNGEWKKCEAFNGEFHSDMDDSRIFWAHISGLEPGTKYEYNCGNNEYRSGNSYFITARKNCDKFKFLLLSDVQTGDCDPPADYTLLGEFCEKIFEKHSDIDFILTGGDNTNCGQTDVQWTGLLDGMKNIINHVPFMMAMGNHDDMVFDNYFTKTGKYYSDKATYFSSQFRGSYNYNGPEDWKTANYSFDYGNSHFDCIGLSGPEYVNEWLIKDVDASGKTWKFGSHHFPICYGGTNLACEDSYPVMMEGLEKFDILFSGHEHSYARSYPRRRENLYSKPSEGTIHYNLGSGNRNPPGTRVVPKVWNACTYEHEVELSMYAIAEVDSNVLTLTSYLEDGTIIDKCIIDKNKDEILPYNVPPKYNKTRIKFKGADLGIGACETFPEQKDGNWFITPAVMFALIGGDVKRSEGKVRIEAYRHWIEFTENSDIAVTDRGKIKMCAPVYRSQRDQLYADTAALCKAFDMRMNYFYVNNFLSFELESEHIQVPVQP